MIGLFSPLFLAVAATVVVASFARRVRPVHAAWLSAAAIASVFVAASVGAWAIALGFLAHEPGTRALFGWCREHLSIRHELPWWLGVFSVVVAVAAAIRAVRVGRAWRSGRGGQAGEVHLVAAPFPLAYAQTGRAGGIVVSSGMLAALDPQERRVLLEHERAHLRHRHDRFLVVGSLAAGLWVLNPAVRGLRLALERWADEEAARFVGDRIIVARAIARAALAAHGGVVAPLSMTGADVPVRVEAMLRPPASGYAPGCWAGVGGVLVAVAVAASTLQLHHLAALISAICPG